MQSCQQNSPDQVPCGAVEGPTADRETPREGTLCYLLAAVLQDQWEEVSELRSQEEADTRLLLHALHAA